MVRTAGFDGAAFFAALNAERQDPQCTWKQVGQECGISASTLSRMSQEKDSDVNGFAALATWLGLDVDRFFRCNATKVEPELLTVISSCLHSDPRLNEEATVALDQMIKLAYRSMANQ